VNGAEHSQRVTRAYLRFAFSDAMIFRGYWLVLSVYLVLVADLSPFQLVFLGTAMELSVMVSEIPTGVMADTISRKWSVALSCVVSGSAMAVNGFVTSFPALVACQVAWGIGNTFASGAHVAWATDELHDPSLTDRLLTRAARWQQVGAAIGMIGFGALAWVTDLGWAISIAGAVAIALGVFVAFGFTEEHFTPTREHRLHEARAIFRRGFALARADHQILLVFAATVLVNSGAEAFDRLNQRRLIDLGFPDEPDPIVWFTALGIATLAIGWAALRIVEQRVHGEGAARHLYVAGCIAGAIGLVVLAHAPNDTVGIIGVLFVSGIAWTVIRSVSMIWVNRRATSDVRATLQSFLTQMESTGEIVGGITLGIVAQAGSITVALMCSAALLAVAGITVTRSQAGRRAVPETATVA
jgi:fructose-specific phosphotransferase system IIC component